MALATVHHIHRVGGQTTMNPATLLLLWEAFTNTRERKQGLHILQIGARIGMWPANIYRAQHLGYLRKPKDAHFAPTRRMHDEVRKARHNQRNMR